ncbi:MAG: RNA polymerase sigma factor [Rhizomicrobium sp.]
MGPNRGNFAVERRDAIQSLDRYLWRSAMNLAADQGRSRQTRRRLAETHLVAQERFMPSAEITAEAQEELALVCRTVQQLPPRCHEAFMLRVVRGLPFEVVGHEMKISSRMAKIYVSRTLRSLREKLH